MEDQVPKKNPLSSVTCHEVLTFSGHEFINAFVMPHFDHVKFFACNHPCKGNLTQQH